MALPPQISTAILTARLEQIVLGAEPGLATPGTWLAYIEPISPPTVSLPLPGQSGAPVIVFPPGVPQTFRFDPTTGELLDPDNQPGVPLPVIMYTLDVDVDGNQVSVPAQGQDWLLTLVQDDTSVPNDSDNPTPSSFEVPRIWGSWLFSLTNLDAGKTVDLALIGVPGPPVGMTGPEYVNSIQAALTAYFTAHPGGPQGAAGTPGEATPEFIALVAQATQDVADADLASQLAAASASNAASSAGAAGVSRTAALNAQTAAEAAANLALTGQLLGTVYPSGSDLNAATSAGVIRVTGGSGNTLELGYPFVGFYGTVDVRTRQTGRATHIAFPTNNVNDFDSRRFFIRTQLASGWSSWKTYSSCRFDQSVGRVMYAWNDLTNSEQIVYSDTGWRDISSSFINGWTGSAYLRRVGSSVELIFANLAGGSSTGVLTLPSGFTPRFTIPAMARPSSPTANPIYGNIGTTGVVSLSNSSAFHGQSMQLTLTTVDNWPSSLPGIAVGSIPNL